MVPYFDYELVIFNMLELPPNTRPFNLKSKGEIVTSLPFLI